MGLITVPITQAITTRAEIDAAATAGSITKGRIYYLDAEDVLVVGTGPNAYVEVGSGGGVPGGGLTGQVLGKLSDADQDADWIDVDVVTKGENIPGSGQPIQDAVNAHTFDGPDSDGAGRMCISSSTIAYVGYDNTVYRYFGPSSVCIGAGGAGGEFPHYVTEADDWVPTGSTVHGSLTGRDAADSHPTAAITGLDADQAAQNIRLDSLEAHGHSHNELTGRDAAGSHPQAAITDLVTDQAAQDSRLTALELHPGRTDNPHGVTQAQVGLGNVDNTADLDKPISTATQAALDLKLENVEDDTAPVLGGSLRTKGHVIEFNNSLEEPRGLILENEEAPANEPFFGLVFLDSDGGYDYSYGGVLLKSGKVDLLGTNVEIRGLADPASPQRQVYVSEEGILYAVDPPDPGWEVTDTDAGDYDLGTGTDVGPWVQMTGLVITVPEDVPAGNRLDVFANVHVVNKTGNRSGTIDGGFGVNGAEPSSQVNFSIPPGFDGMVPFQITTTTHGGLTAGDTISVWARRASGSHAQFGIDLIGSAGDEHELIASVPGDSGGGGGGDPTNITITHGASSVTVNSSTGTNGTINPAGAQAGVMSAAMKATLDSALQSVNLAATHSPTGVTITNTGGNNANIQLATGTNAGVMDPNDKDKLDTVASGAQPDQDAAGVPVSGTPDNYTPASGDVQGHLEGIDDALGSVGGGGLEPIQVALSGPDSAPELNKKVHFTCPYNGTIREMHLGAGDRPTGSNLVVRVDRSATWSGSGSLVGNISMTANTYETNPTGYTQTVTKDDKLTAYVTNIDSGGTAKDLVLTVYVEPS